MNAQKIRKETYLTFHIPSGEIAKVGHRFGDELCFDASAKQIFRFLKLRLWRVHLQFAKSSCPEVYPVWKGQGK